MGPPEHSVEGNDGMVSFRIWVVVGHFGIRRRSSWMVIPKYQFGEPYPPHAVHNKTDGGREVGRCDHHFNSDCSEVGTPYMILYCSITSIV